MNNYTDDLKQVVNSTNVEINNISFNVSFLESEEELSLGREPLERLINKKMSSLTPEIKERFYEEYFGFGPLKNLFDNNLITEIIINNFESIWIELNGELVRSEDNFYSALTFEMFLKRFYLTIGAEPTLTHPFVDSNWMNFRIHIIGQFQQDHKVRMTFRKHRKEFLSFKEIVNNNWCSENESDIILKILHQKKNFLVIGPTSSGKTTILKSLLKLLPNHERVVTIEDSLEIGSINESSTNLLSRFDNRDVLTNISLTDLVKQTLRMRPDRLVVGEVRGGEAKDLLLALATGHHGSAGTLHAAHPQQALTRLEMLIQMGAPNWSLSAIRKLISMSIDYLIICNKNNSGKRKLTGIYKVVGTEESGVIIEDVSSSSYSFGSSS